MATILSGPQGVNVIKYIALMGKSNIQYVSRM